MAEAQQDEARSNIFQRSEQPEGHREHVGKTATAIRFYEVEDEEGSVTWTEHEPPSLPQAEKEKLERVAIQIYKVVEDGPTSGKVPQCTATQIIIQSPFLCQELGPTFEKHGLELYNDTVEINRPFSALFFERDFIYRLSQTAEDQDTKDHLTLLCKVIDDELGPVIDLVDALQREKKITFKLLWTLFPPDTLVMAWENSYHQGYRVTGASTQERTTDVLDDEYPRRVAYHPPPPPPDYDYNGAPARHRRPIRRPRVRARRDPSPGRGEYLNVDCQYVQFDGNRYGYATRALSIASFEGKKDITDLQVYPYMANTSPESLHDTLVKRGEQVLHFQEVRYMQYNGLVVQRDRSHHHREVIIDSWNDETHGRVIIDFEMYAKNMNWRHDIEPLSGDEFKERVTAVEAASSRLTKDEQEKNGEVVRRNRTNLFLMSPVLDGFSLDTKVWTRFNVDLVSDVCLNLTAFDHLVLAENKKQLVYSLVEGHMNLSSSLTDDVIAGKGQGLLVLLSGLPGTGKTLMAEAVADKIGCPLYYVNAQDLGETSGQISRNLQTIFNNAAEWKALVLLDEADVYLKERSSNRNYRSEVVTVFLRLLEGYKGTMFLTTNLYSTIDKAIESRVHVHVIFPRLDPPARTTIWRNFLGRLPPTTHHLTPQDTEHLGAWTLNGRQIKNALAMTLIWCKQNGKEVTLEAVENIISVTCPRAEKGEEAERRDELASGEGKRGVGSLSLTDLEVDDVVEAIEEW
ncbi:hypothetical protein MMC30_000889 [Trapelia coarctata]|nr:hypothetical protein [Trapelia coarctata]